MGMLAATFSIVNEAFAPGVPSATNFSSVPGSSLSTGCATKRLIASGRAGACGAAATGAAAFSRAIVDELERPLRRKVAVAAEPGLARSLACSVYEPS